MTGDVDYDGTLRSEVKIPYTYCGIKDWCLEGRKLYGLIIWRANSHLECGPFSGLGVRLLCNDYSADPHGYDRRSMYVYLPIGVTLKCYCKKGLAFDICGEFDWLLFGSQRSDVFGGVFKVRNI